MSTRRKLNLPQLDADIMVAWGVVAFMAFLGIAAIGLYVGTVSQAIFQ